MLRQAISVLIININTGCSMREEESDTKKRVRKMSEQNMAQRWNEEEEEETDEKQTSSYCTKQTF